MQKTKKWSQSKTIWGIVITAIAFFAQSYLQADITVPANPDFTQLQNIAAQVKAAHSDISGMITAAIAGIGVIMGIIGRVKSDTKIAAPKLLAKLRRPKTAMLIGFMFIASIAGAQIQVKTNIFHPVPKPDKLNTSFFNPVTRPDISAKTLSIGGSTLVTWRMTPMAGYNINTKAVMAGIGYGPQWMKYVDSLQKWKTTFSLQIVGWVQGSTDPSLNPPNFTSFGVSAGLKNQLFIVGAAWTPPTNLTKGTVGFVVQIGFAENN